MEKKYLDYEGLANVAGKVNSRLKTVTEMPSTANDGAIRLYVGETDEYTKGHIYQYSEENEQWIDISPAGGDGWEVVETMPASAPNGTVVLFNGHSTVDYAHGGAYRMTNGSWEFLGALVQIVEVPFTLSFDSISAISSGDTKRTLTFTASEETTLTEEAFSGITANGVIQGKFWNDIGGSISQIDETHFKVELDTNVTDSLGQLAQFPEGSSITIPGFSWIDGITRYVHNAETITISETVVNQKLAFNTTGTLDGSTQATSFAISNAYEVPFALSYQNIPTVTMIDSNYENEVTQSWTPSIVAAHDTTTLVFTPTDSTALHGDNIAVTSGTLTAVSNGVTYTYDFSTDNINLRWGNTTWSFGVYNNFASFTAAPTSANTGSATLTLNPTGPGATERELAFMAHLLPTVTINDNGETKEFANVSWTQGSIVVSGASEVTSVANKLITVTWSDDVTSDFDTYGVECFVNVNALSLSATCAYIDHNITFSNPVLNHTSGETDVQVELTASESLPSTLFADYTGVTLRTRAVLQGRLVTSDSTANASASGTSFYINEIPNLVDSLDQRAVYATGSNVVIGAFEYIDGDDKYIHASQTINASETLTTQKLAFNTTGTLDTSTGVTTFVINASNVVPFVLSTSDTFTAAMLASGYGAETTVTWTPSINYGDSSTELIFTPDNTTALHGDNITFANKVLNFTSNGVTYEIDTSEDTLNVKWANTSYDFGTFNNFASFTAAPTSANSGSVTCTMSPTGPGSTALELGFMAANLPTVYIDSTECSTVAWTQGSIVASGATGVTSVAGKTINVVWDANDYSDTDSYGITRVVHFVAKALSATCAYITYNITLSNPVPFTDSTTGKLLITLTTNVGNEENIHIPNSEFTASATGVYQAHEITSVNDSTTYSSWGDQDFTITFDSTKDKFNQRMVFTSDVGTVDVSAFDYINGDYRIIHSASQNFSIVETPGEQAFDLSYLDWYYTMASYPTCAFPEGCATVSGSTTLKGTMSMQVIDRRDSSIATNPFNTFRIDSAYNLPGKRPRYYITMNSPTEYYDYDLWNSSEKSVTFTSSNTGKITFKGVTYSISSQTFTIPMYMLSGMIFTTDEILQVSSNFQDNGSGENFNFVFGVENKYTPTLTSLIYKAFSSGKIQCVTSLGSSNLSFDANDRSLTYGWGLQANTTYNSSTQSYDLTSRTANISGPRDDEMPSSSKANGTITVDLSNIDVTLAYGDLSVRLVSGERTSIQGTHTYSYYYDDDDCDDDCE